MVKFSSFIISFLFLLLIGFKSSAQTWRVGIYLNGINYHIKKPINDAYFKRAFGKEKRFAFSIGCAIRVSYYLNDFSGLTITQAIVLKDCANQFFGMTQCGVFVSSRYFNNSKHEVVLIGGPLLFYRKSWTKLSNYIDDGVMKLSNNENWQYRFVWHGGFLEYNYFYDQYNSLGLHLMPGVPELLSLSVVHSSFLKK